MKRYKTKRMQTARGRLLATLAAKCAQETGNGAKPRSTGDMPPAGGAKPLSLQWCVEKVREFFKKKGIPHVCEARLEDGEQVRFVASIVNRHLIPIDTFTFRIDVNVAGGFITSSFNFPAHAPSKRRAAVGEFCSYFSTWARFMKLSMDVDGEIQTEMSIPPAALLDNPHRQLDRMLGMQVEMLGRSEIGLMEVFAGKDPVKVFKSCQAAERQALDDDDHDEPGSSRDGDSDEVDCEFGQPEAAPEGKSGRKSSAGKGAPLARNYSLEGLNLKSPVGLDQIVRAVRKFRSAAKRLDPDAPRLNLLLSGPPGTGKTEFVKYLGQQTGSPVKVVTASELLSPLLGGTEKQIAEAFAAAKKQNAILFLDELDSFLSNREGAFRSWEVTQVNELLQQMENFGGIMVGATNFQERLDPAVLRRFTYKLQFDYLDDAGKAIFFKRFFKSPLSAEERKRLDAIRDLAPGDFRTVRQSLYYIADKPTNAQRLEALEAESRAKSGGHAARMGF